MEREAEKDVEGDDDDENGSDKLESRFLGMSLLFFLRYAMITSL